jgi:hypothetical protein
VMISVVAHGATADPVATRHARLLTRQTGGRTDAEVPGIPERRLIRRAVNARGAEGGGTTAAGGGGEDA